jgi:hypothetical protein
MLASVSQLSRRAVTHLARFADTAAKRMFIESTHKRRRGTENAHPLLRDSAEHGEPHGTKDRALFGGLYRRGRGVGYWSDSALLSRQTRFKCRPVSPIAMLLHLGVFASDALSNRR